MAGSRLELIDSSAWIEFLRASGSPTDAALTGRVEAGSPLATTEPVVMELLADPRDGEVRLIKRALAGCRLLPVETYDWEDAAAIYGRCRRRGVTPRSLLDCLIAAVTIRSGAALLAQDRDFELIAEHTALELVTS